MEQRLREFLRRLANLIEFFFRLIFDLPKIFDRHLILCGNDTGGKNHEYKAGRKTR